MEEIIEKSFPFDAVEDELGIADRIFYAEDFAGYFAQFISNGVFPNPSTGLKVQSLNNNMVLTVSAGKGFISGYGYILNENLPIAINPSHISYNRKDNIVLQLNLTTRENKIIYKVGTAVANPVAPSVVRNADIYELKLAEILVKSGAVSILQSDITDTRLNTSVCGIVHAVVSTVDTTAIFNQYENYLNQKIAEWDTTKAQQGVDWQSQMTNQQGGFNTQKNEIQGWYDSVKVDISLLQTFDFDNLSSFPGCTLTSAKTANSYTDTITLTATGKKVADRTETKTDTAYITVIRVYKDDGLTVDKTINIAETRIAEGYKTVIS